MGYFWTIVTLAVALGLAWRYLGSYMAAVLDGRVHFLGWVERPVYRALGTSPDHEQTWKRYAGSLIIFSAVSMGVTYLILRIQGSLRSTLSTSMPSRQRLASTPRPRSSRTRTGRTTAERRRCRTSPRSGRSPSSSSSRPL